MDKTERQAPAVSLYRVLASVVVEQDSYYYCLFISDKSLDNSRISLIILFSLSSFQGVRTKTVKRSARTIVEKYYTRLTIDFHSNKRVVDDVAILPSKRMRNKIAGYTTHLMRRIAKGPVRGISLKLQEEERERRLDFVPEVSALEAETIQIDPDTRDMLESLGFGSLNGVAVNQSSRE